MSKSDYDYVVEMMKEYEPEDNQKRRCIINYEAIAEGLCITKGKVKVPASVEVKRKFREEYEKYVNRTLRMTKEPLAIIVFQGRYNPPRPINFHRKEMTYIEDCLSQVINSLPRLPKGEKYVFPILRIIKDEEGTDAFIISI